MDIDLGRLQISGKPGYTTSPGKTTRLRRWDRREFDLRSSDDVWTPRRVNRRAFSSGNAPGRRGATRGEAPVATLRSGRTSTDSARRDYLRQVSTETARFRGPGGGQRATARRVPGFNPRRLERSTLRA